MKDWRDRYLRIAFIGDLAIFDEGLLGSAWEERLKSVADVLSEFDVVIANLEVPLTDRNNTMVCKGIHLRSDRKVIPLLKYLNITGVSLANNHICDFGISGMDDTIQLLEEAGISYFGVDNRSWLFTHGPEKVHFHGYCCYSANGAHYIRRNGQRGVNSLTRMALMDDLKRDRVNGALSVISLHWGDEYSQLPNERQVSLVHNLAKENSFILHGHHAHVMQGVEDLGQSLSAYNQGNFCFDPCRSPINSQLCIKQSALNKESFILAVDLAESKIQSWSTIGIRYCDDGIQIIDNNARVQELSSLIAHCEEQSYKDEIVEMIQAQKRQNLNAHDFKWLLSKLNYHSIGAKLQSYRNKRRFSRAMRE